MRGHMGRKEHEDHEEECEEEHEEHEEECEEHEEECEEHEEEHEEECKECEWDSHALRSSPSLQYNCREDREVAAE